MRPWNETAENRAAELELFNRAKRIMERHSGTVAKFHPFDDLEYDWTIERDGVPQTLIEAKCRTRRYGEFPTWHIGWNKVHNLRRKAEQMECEAWFCVGWSCGTFGFVAIMDVIDCATKEIGRRDRGQTGDIELGYDVPLGEFYLYGPEGVP